MFFRVSPIDYRGTIIFSPDDRRIEFDGFVDVFPAFEAYCRINDGPAAKLFNIAPDPGISAVNLFNNWFTDNGGDVPVHVLVSDTSGDQVLDHHQTV